MTETINLLNETRNLLHEVLMGLPIDKDRHERLLDLHDRTREVCAEAGIKITAPKKDPLTEKIHTVNNPPADLSVDDAVVWLRKRGVQGSREVLRQVVKNSRS